MLAPLKFHVLSPVAERPAPDPLEDACERPDRQVAGTPDLPMARSWHCAVWQRDLAISFCGMAMIDALQGAVESPACGVFSRIDAHAATIGTSVGRGFAGRRRSIEPNPV
ncbi:MAG: hypothetical protein QOF70_2823 [Acetobacteraceae bacterium]|jgi:hypothetical protein|nr:hypothetical protein [Acetobacteraceae bacterium]